MNGDTIMTAFEFTPRYSLLINLVLNEYNTICCLNSDAVVSKRNTCTMNVVVQAPVVQILDSTDPLDKPPSSG